MKRLLCIQSLSLTFFFPQGTIANAVYHHTSSRKLNGQGFLNWDVVSRSDGLSPPQDNNMEYIYNMFENGGDMHGKKYVKGKKRGSHSPVYAHGKASKSKSTKNIYASKGIFVSKGNGYIPTPSPIHRSRHSTKSPARTVAPNQQQASANSSSRPSMTPSMVPNPDSPPSSIVINSQLTPSSLSREPTASMPPSQLGDSNALFLPIFASPNDGNQQQAAPPSQRSPSPTKYQNYKAPSFSHVLSKAPQGPPGTFQSQSPSSDLDREPKKSQPSEPFQVKIMPFTLLYKLKRQHAISKEQFALISNMTQTHLRTYLAVESADFVSMLGNATNTWESPAMITYELLIYFRKKDLNVFLVDRYIMDAFSKPFVRHLIESMHQLPSSNPFASVTEIKFATGSEKIGPSQKDSANRAMVWGIAVSVIFVGIFISVCLALTARFKQKQQIHSQTQHPREYFDSSVEESDIDVKQEMNDLLSFRDEMYLEHLASKRHSENDSFPSEIFRKSSALDSEQGSSPYYDAASTTSS